MQAETLTERLCQTLYDEDLPGYAAELARLARTAVAWPEVLCGLGAYAARYRVTDWFSVHWYCCLTAGYLLAERCADPARKVLSFGQGAWILCGAGESSFAGFKGWAAGRRAQPLHIPAARLPLAGVSEEIISNHFLAAFRAQQIEDCQALLLGAYRAGWTRRQIKQLILRAATDRYATSGHQLLVASWFFRLLERTDWRNAELHLACMIAPLIGQFLQIHEFPALPDEARFAGWLNNTGALPANAQPFLNSLLDDEPAAVVTTVAALFDAGVAAEQICRLILAGMSERTLRIPSPDVPDASEAFGWAFCLGQQQHVVTAVHVLRDWLAEPTPAALRAVFQEALFLNSLKRHELIAPHADFAPLTLVAAPVSAVETLSQLRTALETEQGARAAALAESYLQAGHAPELLLELFLNVQQCGFSPFTIPEHYSHGVKFIQAVIDEGMAPQPAELRFKLLTAAAKIIAGFTRKEHTLHNQLRAALAAAAAPGAVATG